ncbi:MAG: hypothetical protein M1836_001662 [Candelina mexicana]|nr:MAG: hypothetical protein M1836_001662 [Candelina mexicana]
MFLQLMFSVGSISLASWIFLSVPQLVENYNRGSADGVSLAFLTVWFVGDVTNFCGAVWAGLVPTVIALAAYFICAELVLITQCLYYKIINAKKAERHESTDVVDVTEREAEEPLLGRSSIGPPGSRRRSSTSQRQRGSQVSSHRRDSLSIISTDEQRASRIWLKNLFSVILICAVGSFGWFIAWKSGAWSPTPENQGAGNRVMGIGPQILGYLSACEDSADSQKPP